MLRTIGAGAASLLALCLGAGAAFAQTPGAAEAIDHADYSKGEHWLCLPGRQDACTIPLDASIVSTDGSVKRATYRAEPNPGIDCFYVYPTVSNDPFSTSDLQANSEELNVVESQFARFGSVCRTFAPMYRQVTLPQLRARFGGAAPPQRGAAAQGAADVDDAWDYYMKNYNNGRGVVIIGHSQGAGQGARLIKEKIDGKPV